MYIFLKNIPPSKKKFPPDVFFKGFAELVKNKDFWWQKLIIELKSLKKSLPPEKFKISEIKFLVQSKQFMLDTDVYNVSSIQ